MDGGAPNRAVGAAAIAVACSLLAASGARSDDPVVEQVEQVAPVEEIVVTGSLSPRPAALIPSATSVYDAEAIEASQTAGLTEFFRFIPGLHVAQAGARGGRAALYLRGLDPNQVVVLLDGVRLNDPTNLRGGAVDPTTLAPNDVERIEVVRGPLSAVYGSDALAGAINIITPRTSPDAVPSFSASATGGRFDTWSASGRASGGLGFAGLNVGGGYDTNGDPYSPGGYAGGNLKASIDADLPGRIDMRATVRFNESDSEAFPEASGGPERAVSRQLEHRDETEVSSGLQLQQAATDWLDLGLRVSHSHRWENLDSPAIAPVQPQTKSDDEWGRTDLSVQARLYPLDALEVTLGGDVYWEEGQTDTTYLFPGFQLPGQFDLHRRVAGFFAEAWYQLPLGLGISGSIRGDFPDDDETEWSPAVGATLEIPKTPLTIYGSWSEGFKLPSFFALANALVGNPNLKSEHSRGWEAGLRAELWGGRLESKLGYFDIRVDDLIDFDPITFMLVNRTSVVSRGVELEIEAVLTERIRVGGSASYNPTDIRDSSDDLPRRPRWKGELHASASPLENVDVGARVVFVGDSTDYSVPTGDRTLNDYAKVDLTASWQIHEGITLLLVVENLLDSHFEEAIGFPDVGIYPRLGVRYRF